MAYRSNVRRTSRASGYRSSGGGRSRGGTARSAPRRNVRGGRGARRTSAPRQQVVKLQLQVVPSTTQTMSSGIVDAFNQQAAVPKQKAKF